MEHKEINMVNALIFMRDISKIHFSRVIELVEQFEINEWNKYLTNIKYVQKTPTATDLISFIKQAKFIEIDPEDFREHWEKLDKDIAYPLGDKQ